MANSGRAGSVQNALKRKRPSSSVIVSATALHASPDPARAHTRAPATPLRDLSTTRPARMPAILGGEQTALGPDDPRRAEAGPR